MNESPASVVINNFTYERCACGDMVKSQYGETYLTFNYIIVICCMPVLALFGLVGNIFNIVVFAQARMRKSSANIYLVALSISDFMLVWCGLVMFWMDSARHYMGFLKNSPYLVLYTLPLGMTVQTTSVYIIVFAAIDCFISVCHRKLAPRYCTPRLATYILGWMLLASLAYNSLRIGQLFVRQCAVSEHQTTLEICPTEYFVAVQNWYNVYCYAITMTLVPFVLLAILNVLIVCKVRQQSNNSFVPANLNAHLNTKALFDMTIVATALGNDHSQPCIAQFDREEPQTEAPQEDNEPDDPVTMIMVVLLFLVCNTMALVINIVETFFNPSLILLNYMTDVSNLLVMLNGSVNVIIYLMYSPTYVCTIRELFSKKDKLALAKCSTLVLNNHHQRNDSPDNDANNISTEAKKALIASL